MLPQSIRNIEHQLTTMNVEVYEVGVRLPKEITGEESDRMMLFNNRGVGLKPCDILSTGFLDKLGRENAKGYHVYIRPYGPSNLTLIDDLTINSVELMRQSGYTPACVVETSPGNFQAWLRHERVLSKEEATIAAKILAEKFSGDPNSADWRHFGRLAGYTNPKEKYKQQNGRFPFSKVNYALSEGQSYEQARQIEQQIHERMQEQEQQYQKAVQNYERIQSLPQDQKKVLPYEHFANMYGEGQRFRTDYSYALHCLQRNVPEHEIIHTIRTQTTTSSFINKSNHEKEQYLKRTLDNARKAAGKQPFYSRQQMSLSR